MDDNRIKSLLETTIYYRIFFVIFCIITQKISAFSMRKRVNIEKFCTTTNYVYFWLIFSSAITLYLTISFRKKFALPVFVFNFYMLFFVPMGFLWGAILFIYIERGINNFAELQEVKNFLNFWELRLYSRKEFHMWILPAIIMFFGLLTLLLPKDSYFKQINHYVILLFFTSIVFFISGHAAYFIIKSTVFLFKLVRLRLKFRFGHKMEKLINYLSDFTYGMSLLSFGGYILLFFAIRFGAIDESGTHTPLTPVYLFNGWISILALLPSLSLILGILQIHTLLLRIKFFHMDVLEKRFKNEEIILQKNQKYLALRKYIENMAEWPITLQSITTLIITLMPFIFQIFLFLSSKSK